MGKMSKRLLRPTGLRWLTRDEFTDEHAGGALTGTYATDGHSVRTVTDTNSKMSTAAGVLSVTTGGAAAYDPGMWYSAVTSRAGQVLVAEITPASTTPDNCGIGFDVNAAGAISDAFQFRALGVLYFVQATAGAAVGVYTAVSHKIAIQKRSGGGNFYFIKGGAFANWTLIFPGIVGGTYTFPAIEARSTTSVFTSDSLRVLNARVPSSLASDSFNRSNGAPGNTDGAGVAEPGGGDIAWTAGGGAIAGNALAITPTLGAEEASGALVVGTWYSITATEVDHFFTGCAIGNTFRATATTALDASNKVKAISMPTAITTLTLPTVNHWIDAEVSALTAGTQAGIITRLDSAAVPANFIIANFDGQGNVKVVEYVAGVPNQLITAAKAFTASDHVQLSLDGTAVRCYHTTAAGVATLIGAGTTAVITGSLAGCFGTDATNLINAFVAWPKQEGWFSYLDRFVRP